MNLNYNYFDKDRNYYIYDFSNIETNFLKKKNPKRTEESIQSDLNLELEFGLVQVFQRLFRLKQEVFAIDNLYEQIFKYL